MMLHEAYALLGGSLADTLNRLSDQTLLMRHLKQFPKDSAMPMLRAAMETGNEADIWRAAHGLRGACRALGLGDLAEAAGQCMAAPKASWERLERAYDRAVAVIGLVSDRVECHAETVEPPRSFDGIRALLAEDDRLCAETLAELLASLGLRVRMAGDGGEALRLARQGGFDCVFLDAHMPGLDGLTTVRGISQALPDTPIFAVTAGMRPDEETRMREAGLKARIDKPAERLILTRLLSDCFPEGAKRAVSS